MFENLDMNQSSRVIFEESKKYLSDETLVEEFIEGTCLAPENVSQDIVDCKRLIMLIDELVERKRKAD